jgi:3-oxoadipate enol-lactonase
MPEFQLPSRPEISLYYELAGEPGAPLVVLLNGMSQSTANWRTQARRLAERFQVLSYDARCQGRSTVVDEPLTLDDHALDLRDLLDHLGAKRIVLVGFSHGARVALHTAPLLGGRCIGLSLSGTGADGDAMREVIVRSWREVLQRGGIEALAWCTIPDILGRNYLESLRGQWEPMVRATVQRNDAAGLGRLLEGLAGYAGPEEDARQIQCPAQLLSGREDLLVSIESAQRLAGMLNNCEHVIFDHVGHTLPIEAPEPWRARVDAFLTQVTA